MPKISSNKQKFQNLEKVRHSLAHLMAAAVLKKYPDAKLGIGPVIDDGFYYDFLLPSPLSAEDLPRLEDTMRDLIEQKLPFKKKVIPYTEAKKLLKGQPFKLELINEFNKAKSPISFYIT